MYHNYAYFSPSTWWSSFIVKNGRNRFLHPHKEQKIASFIVNACVNMVSLNMRFICTGWEPRGNAKLTKHFLLFPLNYKKSHHYITVFCIIHINKDVVYCCVTSETFIKEVLDDVVFCCLASETFIRAVLDDVVFCCVTSEAFIREVLDDVVFCCVTSETVVSRGKRYIINDVTRNRLKNCIDKIQMCHTLIVR